MPTAIFNISIVTVIVIRNKVYKMCLSIILYYYMFGLFFLLAVPRSFSYYKVDIGPHLFRLLSFSIIYRFDCACCFIVKYMRQPFNSVSTV